MSHRCANEDRAVPPGHRGRGTALCRGGGGALAFLAAGRDDGTVPLGLGCYASVAPITTLIGPFPLPGHAAGEGEFLLPVDLTERAPSSLCVEVYVVDAYSLFGVAKSNALTIHVE